MGSILKYGLVTKVDKDKLQVVVYFPEINIVSAPLPVIVMNTQDNKDFYLPDINEYVVCVVDERCEHGVVMGSIYSKEDVPFEPMVGVRRVTYKDGTIISYDRVAHEYKISFNFGTHGEDFIMNANGFTIRNGIYSLKSILSDFITQIKLLTVIVDGIPSTPPVNSAAFDLIQAQIEGLLEH